MMQFFRIRRIPRDDDHLEFFPQSTQLRQNPLKDGFISGIIITVVSRDNDLLFQIPIFGQLLTCL